MIPDWTAKMIHHYESLHAAVQQAAPSQKSWLGQYLQVDTGWVNWAELTRKGSHVWLRSNREATLHFSERVGTTVFIREQDGRTTRELTFNTRTRQVTEYAEAS